MRAGRMVYRKAIALLILCAMFMPVWSAMAGAGGGSGGIGLFAKGAVPEPASILGLVTGVGGLLILRWRKRR